MAMQHHSTPNHPIHHLQKTDDGIGLNNNNNNINNNNHDLMFCSPSDDGFLSAQSISEDADFYHLQHHTPYLLHQQQPQPLHHGSINVSGPISPDSAIIASSKCDKNFVLKEEEEFGLTDDFLDPLHRSSHESSYTSNRQILKGIHWSALNYASVLDYPQSHVGLKSATSPDVLDPINMNNLHFQHQLGLGSTNDSGRLNEESLKSHELSVFNQMNPLDLPLTSQASSLISSNSVSNLFGPIGCRQNLCKVSIIIITAFFIIAICVYF